MHPRSYSCRPFVDDWEEHFHPGHQAPFSSDSALHGLKIKIMLEHKININMDVFLTDSLFC